MMLCDLELELTFPLDATTMEGMEGFLASYIPIPLMSQAPLAGPLAARLHLRRWI